MNKIIQINPADNVAVALEAIEAGGEARFGAAAVTAAQAVPAGHKLALRDIAQGGDIIKYGYPIGVATRRIAAGQWVHTHNVKTGLGDLLDYTYSPSFSVSPAQKPDTFMGYMRKDGKVGIRNEVWIVPTVGCVNSIARQIEEKSQKFLADGIDGIFSYTHPYGCSQLSQDLLNTQLALSGLIRHPNAAAVLVLGLGCENNHIEALKKVLGGTDSNRVKFLVCQDEKNETEAALKIMEELCAYAARCRRTPCSTAHLIAGLKCGGSDGFSGITANPLAGVFSDMLIARGGTAVMTEVPEMFGAETVLMSRCRDKTVFDKTAALINDFKRYFVSYDQKIDANPSPGNKAGGITTLEEKSLGCIQKGGVSPVNDVLAYGQPVKETGLNLLQAPGNDLVSSAALAVSGTQLVLFTTGRGTPFGCPVPTVKISTNSELFRRKPGWIDFDAGELLRGKTLAALGGELYNYVLQVASGAQKTKSEAFDKHDFAIFKDGVTL